MSRWAVRIAGIVMILVFLLLFAHLQRQLLMLQRARQPAATTTR